MGALSKLADGVPVLIPYKCQKTRGVPEAGKAGAHHWFKAASGKAQAVRRGSSVRSECCGRKQQC